LYERLTSYIDKLWTVTASQISNIALYCSTNKLNLKAKLWNLTSRRNANATNSAVFAFFTSSATFRRFSRHHDVFGFVLFSINRLFGAFSYLAFVGGCLTKQHSLYQGIG